MLMMVVEVVAVVIQIETADKIHADLKIRGHCRTANQRRNGPQVTSDSRISRNCSLSFISKSPS